MRLLLAVGEAAADVDQVPSSIQILIREADEIFVMSPTLPSRIGWLASDTDKARQAGDARLQTVLSHVREMGGQAAGGTVGSDDPLVAFEDAVEEFLPDHILVALRGSDQATWQERGLIEQVQDRFGLPTTVFSLDPA